MAGRWTIQLGRSGGGREQGPVGRAAGRVVGTLFFGIFLAMGLFFLVALGREVWRGAETFGWSERRCEIDRSQVARGGGEQPYRPEVAFHTVDAGPPARGGGIRRGELSLGSHGEATERLAPYPVGGIVSCHVSDSGEAVLERGPLWLALWMLLPLVFVAIGGGGLVYLWKPERRDAAGRPVPEALGDGAGKRRPGRALVTLGVAFATIGGALLFFFGVRPLWNVHQARDWDRQLCTVEHSSVVSHRSDDGTTYSVDILYRWDRGRGVERSSRYGFFGGSSSGYEGKAEIARAHRVGAEVGCWVHPQRTNEAVLERGLTPIMLVALVPLGFFVAGVALVVAGRRRARTRARMREQISRGGSPFAPDDPVLEILPDFELTLGPVTLAAESSRWARLAGITFAALFWNGIVSVFAHQVWESWQRGHSDTFTTLFLVPFVLVGIALCLGVVHGVLALRNPRPRLVMSNATLGPGQRSELRWEFTGAAQRLANLRVTLKGVEHATYQVGTDTRTASEDFHEQVLADLPAPLCQGGGHATLAIPATAMHSFESRHNKIVWQLELVGEIARWPDVKETYPLVVLPRPAGDAKSEDRWR